MLRKIGLVFLGIALCTTTQVMAMEQAFSFNNLNEPLSLNPDVPKQVTNFTPFPFNITCMLKTKDKSNFIEINLQNGVGKIDGQEMHPGDRIGIVIQDKQTMNIEAGPKTRVNFINRGRHTVYAHCSLR